MYSPRSVVNSMRFRKISNYWNQTETFEALQMYIDMNFEHLKDDVLRLLIHLGYLAYDDKTKTVKIPNSEIRAEYVNMVSVSDWRTVSKALKDSADTLYAARNFYTIHRELAGGKGFADLVFIPKKQFAEKPALVVELKWDKSAESAIKQMKEKK